MRAEGDAARRAEYDRDLVARMPDAIIILFPGCSRVEAQTIVKHTAHRKGGRVGRTLAGQALDKSGPWPESCASHICAVGLG